MPPDALARKPLSRFRPRAIVVVFSALMTITLCSIGLSAYQMDQLSQTYARAIDDADEWRGLDADVAAAHDLLTRIYTNVSGIPSRRLLSFEAKLVHDMHGQFQRRLQTLEASLKTSPAWGRDVAPRLIATVAEARLAEQQLFEQSARLLGDKTGLSEADMLSSLAGVAASYRMATLKLAKVREFIDIAQQGWWARRFDDVADQRLEQKYILAAAATVIGLVVTLVMLAQSRVQKLGSELQHAQILYESQAEAMNGVVYKVRLGSEWILEYMSANSEKLFGVPASHVIGQRADLVLWWMLRKRDRQKHLDTVKRALETREPYVSEYQVRSPSGRHLWVMERGRVRDAEVPGGAPFLDAMFVDVTPQRELHERLEAREQRLTAMAANFDGVMFRVRLNEQFTLDYVSPGAAELWGIDPVEAIGKTTPALQRILPEDADRCVRTIAASLNGEPYDIEYRIRMDDGEVRWVLERGRVSERDERGLPIFIDGFVVDVTARKEMEAQLADTNARVKHLVECIDEVFFTCKADASWTTIYVSPSIERLSGHAPESLIGNRDLSMRDVVHPEDVTRGQEIILKALSENRPYETEYKIRHKDGSVRWVFERGRFARGADGEMLIHGYIADITLRREAEAALAAARDAAEAANRAKSEFLATISHEIRTPMNGVMGMTSVLLDTDLTAEQRRSALTIRDSADSLLSLLNDVLDFSKLEAQAMEFEQVAFDLHALVQYSREIVLPRARAKSITLKVDILENVPRHVKGDPARIRQILLNYLGNAVKFTNHGEVTTRLSAVGTGTAFVLRLEVQDTGIGIAGDRLDRLFRSFSQADASISRRYGGTGLGLAICKRLAERMGGSVGASSVEGKGSTFWVELPLGVASRDECEATVRPLEAARVEQALESIHAAERKPRLLVAEDNATNQLVVRSVLAKFGLTADYVGNGIEALEAVRQRPYDLILMDVHMPDMDGLEATRAIRSFGDERARIPIIALTANAFAHDVENCIAAGMNGHLGKPFRKEELVIAIGEALAGHKAPGPVNGEPETALQALDADVLVRFCDDAGAETLQLLIDTFLADAADKLKLLGQLAQTGSAGQDAVRIAHSLKSAAAMAGAQALSQASRTLEEHLLNAGTLTSADAARLDGLFVDYQRAVAKHLSAVG